MRRGRQDILVWREPPLLWKAVLFVVGGPLNPALLITLLLGFYIPLTDLSRTVYLLSNCAAPAALAAAVALNTIGRLTMMDRDEIVSAWRRGYFVAVILAPLSWCVVMGLSHFLAAILTGQASILDAPHILLAWLQMAMVRFVGGWLTLAIPIAAIVVGWPCLKFAIFVTLRMLQVKPASEHRSLPTVPTP